MGVFRLPFLHVFFISLALAVGGPSCRIHGNGFFSLPRANEISLCSRLFKSRVSLLNFVTALVY